jgi:tripartite-type tricarboxylate transporter receptor subunit TctC
MSHMPRATQCLQRMLAAMVVAAAAGATCESARAEYPERPITMIVCFPAGGGTDIAARLINTSLGDALGKPVIVENRGGAGGNIGIAAAARAGGDGYTLLVCSSAYVVNPSLYAQAAYDPYKDFVPVMVIGASPNVFVVPAQSDIKTMPELIASRKPVPASSTGPARARARRPISPARSSSCAPASACSTSRSRARVRPPRRRSPAKSTSIRPISDH